MKSEVFMLPVSSGEEQEIFNIVNMALIEQGNTESIAIAGMTKEHYVAGALVRYSPDVDDTLLKDMAHKMAEQEITWDDAMEELDKQYSLMVLAEARRVDSITDDILNHKGLLN